METITYSIKGGEPDSENYYTDVSRFTDIVLEKASDSLIPMAGDFMEYLKRFNLEDLREKEEYILELLSFGVLWKNYSSIALQVRYAPFITMTHMAEWRKKHQRVKPLIDLIRGIVITLNLLPESRNGRSRLIPVIEDIDHVCKWFEATGEFREEALRFIRWRAYWGTKSKHELAKILYDIDEFTLWFEEKSVDFLGRYTANVESFLEKRREHYKWREDRISCTKTRAEYHLNMVGAELMNRAFRKEFETTDERVVLVPGCMRLDIEGCKAKRVKEGLICAGCLADCNVNKLRITGKKKEFSVYIIPHASDLSLWGPQPGRSRRGVIASACVTTLVEGGWELKRYNVPAQCVLLDYCGCSKHWHSQGFPTQFNMQELNRKIIKRNGN